MVGEYRLETALGREHRAQRGEKIGRDDLGIGSESRFQKGSRRKRFIKGRQKKPAEGALKAASDGS